ncbi:MAG: SulP family inorganic anion transporter [Beijerinckiaceae bacterium]
MTQAIANPPQPAGASFSELFTPKLVTVMREGYTLQHLRADTLAGLTVAIVALPLSMAIAIASGATPAQGLYTAIIGGFLVSALGGSRFQIGGPAGAFIVLVFGTVQQHGMDGLILATFLSGIMLSLAGLARIGAYIKFIPYPVTVGFTAGIGVIIFSSQIKELLGLKLTGTEPGPLLEKLPVLWRAMPSLDPVTAAVAAGTVLVIIMVKKTRPHWPVLLIAITLAGLAAWAFKLPVATIGTKFGGIPNALPAPHLPAFSLAKISEVFPNALAFTLLGAIESLLSAVVADGMSGRRHRSNCELVAQGVANVGSSLFGGICVTGTIARTATNVRARAHGPVSGMLHSLFVLLFMLVAAPLASYIPLAALAGILAVVAWDMVEKQAFRNLLRASGGDAAVLLVTLLLTVFRDLTEAIVVGFALGSVLFIHRMSKATAIVSHAPFVPEDRADGADGPRQPYNPAAGDPDIAVYRISGVFFFGAAASIGAVFDSIADTHKALVLDFTAVPFVDSTGANTIEGLARKAHRKNVQIYLAGTSHAVRESLFALGLKPPHVHYELDVAHAVSKARHHIERQGS